MSRIHDALKKAETEKDNVGLPGLSERPSEETARAGPELEARQIVSTARTGAVPPSEKPSSAEELHRLLVERSLQCSWNPDRKVMLSFDRRNPVLGLEEFRTLRSHLYLIREKRPLQKLLVTSPLPQEGKTFVAANLAQVFVRQRERRALLIDADLRSSRLHLSLGAPSAPGLTDYLMGVRDEFSVVQRGPLDNLYFIPRGRPAPNPSELIGNGRLKRLLQSLGPAFDWIILDSPPAILVSDAKLIAELCDGVLIVIQVGATPYHLAQKACQEFGEKRVLGAVLNRSEAGAAYHSYLYPGNSSGDSKKGDAQVQ